MQISILTHNQYGQRARTSKISNRLTVNNPNDVCKLQHPGQLSHNGDLIRALSLLSLNCDCSFKCHLEPTQNASMPIMVSICRPYSPCWNVVMCLVFYYCGGVSDRLFTHNDTISTTQIFPCIPDDLRNSYNSIAVYRQL